MLRAAMVIMILAGIFGLPAAACSTACAGIGAAAGAHNDPNAAGGQAIMETLMWLAVIASIGSIIVGALVRQFGKLVSGGAAVVFALLFIGLMLQANLLGLVPALMLIVAAIMIFVAPAEQFKKQAQPSMPPSQG